MSARLNLTAAASKGGRPPAEREAGSAEKLRVWFEVTRRPRAFVTKSSRQLSAELRDVAPSPKALKHWMFLGIPKAALANFAKIIDVPVHYLHSQQSLENFRTYVLDSQSSAKSRLLPSRLLGGDAAMGANLPVLLEANGNTGRVLRVVINSADPLNVDELADRLNVSVIQVREILESLMIVDIVEIVRDLHFALTGGPARIRLTDRATRNRRLIEGLINAAGA